MKLIIESTKDGTFVYTESEAHHQTVNLNPTGGRENMTRLRLADLANECRVPMDCYLVIEARTVQTIIEKPALVDG